MCGRSPWLRHTGTWGSSGTPRTFTERKQSFVYDTLGHLTARNTEQAVNVDSQTGTRRYSHRYVWDSRWGRLLGEAWPNGVGRGYVYDGVGRVVQENGLGDGMPAVLREVQKIDARGQTIEASLGDCVLGACITQERSYAPSTGQMLTQSYRIGDNKLHSERYRHDYLANLTQRERLNRNNNLVGYERYSYDELQRMTTSQVYGSSGQSQGAAVELRYDAVGNLTRKSDYASTYSYPGGATQPNAPASTSGGPTGTIYYAYDNSGNLIARSPNADPYNVGYQTFTARYNHNQQPIESVTQTGTGATARTESSRYLYDAQNRLSRQIEGAGGSTPEHLIYLEGYEDRVGGYRTRSDVDDYAHVTRYRYGQLELRFVLTDRLGSVVGVVRADRNNTSSPLTVESSLAYDVFGTPRHVNNWTPLGDTESWPQATPPGQSIPTTRHGFTGHEMLSKQRLIHMRGRLFDPRMGRFTGVDPVIQFPLNTQGLNPYSYLLNNPLAGTDPTGYVADWESVQERMWAMAGGYGAAGSTVTAVLSGMRSAAAEARASGASGSVSAGGVASNGASTGQTVGTQSFTGGGAAGLLSQANGPQTCSIKDDPNAFNGEHRALTRGESLRLDWNTFIYNLPIGSGGKSAYHWATDDVVQTITETIDGDYRRAAVSATFSYFPWLKAAKKIGLDDAVESVARRFGDDVAGGIGAYRDVGGHHVHAKRAFETVDGYDLRDAFSVSNGVLEQYGVRHSDITRAQQRLFRQLSASGSPNTLAQHSRIAYQSMVEAGMPPSVAKELVLESQSRLIRSGVVEPARIPWGGGK